MAERMNGGEAIVQAVLAHGIDTVFGLPGAQMYPLFDSLKRHENRVRMVGSRHEQGAAYMALGYALSTGRPSAYSVVPGPGVLNTTAALCTAAGLNAPVLCLTGQIPSEYLGRGRGHLHELPDQLATLRTLIKWAERIETPGEAPRVVGEAFRHMLSGRPGPVSVEMCWDTMMEHAPVEMRAPSEPDAPPMPDPEDIEAAAKILADARHPMIMVGGGAIHASAEVLELAELLDAPVTSFRRGRGIVADDHALGASCAAAWELWRDTDALIGIGSRLELQYMRWTGMMRVVDRPEAPPHVIRIDIDPTEMRRLKPHVGIVSDSADGTRALIEALGPKRQKGPEARQRIAEAKAVAWRKVEAVQPQVAYLDVIREVMPRDGFFVEELCQVGFASYYAFPIYEPRTFVTTGYQGTLGYGFPTALGVKVANPDKAVVSIIGDGGFMFGITELSTAVDHRIGVVTIIFNNGAFGNVLRDQQTRYEGRVIGAEFSNPDFMKLAESFGLAGTRVDSPEALRPALEKALAADAPALIEVIVPKGSEASPWEIMHKMPPRG